MKQLNKIVTDINLALKPSFDCVGGKLYEIAEPVIRREQGDIDGDVVDVDFPAIVDTDGECTDVFIDDDYKIGLYHRIISKAYVTQTNQGFGDNKKQICNAELLAVCWGFKNTAIAEEVESLIISIFPKEVSISETILDKRRVFSGEFKGVNFFVPPEMFLFSIKYKVRYEVKPPCLEINDIFEC